MKKLNLLYALLFVAAFVACKDDDEDPSFKQADFVGTWEVTKFDGLVDEMEAPCRYEFTQTEMEEISGCDSQMEYSLMSGEYQYDGKSKIVLEDSIFGEYTLIIIQLNATTIKFELHWAGQKMGTVTATKQ